MKRVLAIGTHPDDIEIGCGGTLAVLKAKEYQIVHVVVTSGEEGDIDSAKKDVACRREAEAKAAGVALGAAEVHFLREPDGLTSFSKEAKTRLISFVRKYRPDIIFTHAKSDPFPDHQVVHQLTRAAILGAQGPWYPEAGGIPHSVRDVYGYEVWNPISEPQCCFDISAVVKQKVHALRQHASQMEKVNYVDAIVGLARYRGVMSMAGEYAEAFEVIRCGIIA